jgi:orotidine-5'-phosphate decarboxylase
MAVDFSERLRDIQRAKRTAVCIGLDPDPRRLPEHLAQGLDPAAAVVAFNRAVIEATAPIAAAYKLNLAFFEALGAGGWNAIEATLRAMPEDVLTIADGKRGDIGHSANFYARAVFELQGFDACTVSGYMGRDSVTPFLDYEGRAAFLLARTSNPGGADFQDLVCDGEPLFERVVRTAAAWEAGRPGTLGFVAGAVDDRPLRRIRTAAPVAPLLIPGVGAQGGDARAVMRAAGEGPVLVNSTRSIIYASGAPDFAEAAAREAEALRVLLEDARP